MAHKKTYLIAHYLGEVDMTSTHHYILVWINILGSLLGIHKMTWWSSLVLLRCPLAFIPTAWCSHCSCRKYKHSLPSYTNGVFHASQLELWWVFFIIVTKILSLLFRQHTLFISSHVNSYAIGPLTRCIKVWVAHAPGMPGPFSPPPTSKETAS